MRATFLLSPSQPRWTFLVEADIRDTCTLEQKQRSKKLRKQRQYLSEEDSEIESDHSKVSERKASQAQAVSIFDSADFAEILP